LVKDIPIVCGGYDGSCTALGAGNFKENRVYNYVGSSSWISAAADKPLLNQEIKPYCYFHVIPEMYNSTVSIYSAGGSFQWFRNVLGKDAITAGETASTDPYTILENEAANSPVGANGVIFNPSLMGGATIHPSPHIHGAYIGLQLSHTRADLIRAVLEGVAMDLRTVLDCFRSMGVRADEIRIVGGGSKGTLWRQIFADVYHADIILTTVGQEAAALGAAVLAAVGTGVWKDYSMVDSIAKTLEVTKPIEDHTNLYNHRLPLFQFVTDKLLEIGEKELAINKE
jgi:xylulokinase